MEKLVKIRLLLSICGCIAVSGAQDIPKCSKDTASGIECYTTLNNLHPTQQDVGLYVINMTTPEKGTLEKFSDECKDSLDKLYDDIKERGSSATGIAGIINESGIIYLINGHHHTYALNELISGDNNKCNYDGKVYVYIISNQSNLNAESFQQYLIKNNEVWLYNNNGNNIAYKNLPPQLGEMGNNPYRSIIKLVEDSKCNEKNPVIDINNTTTYIEFLWGNRLHLYNSSYINIGSKNAEDYAINSYNYIVNNYSRFSDLPGAKAPNPDKLCDSF